MSETATTLRPRTPATACLVLGGLNAGMAVAMGAYGWHGLEGDSLSQDMFMMASQYQMWHGLALIAAGLAGLTFACSGARKMAAIAGALFQIGIVGFSGTLYVFGGAGFVPVSGAAPAGGMSLMAGWALLAWAAFYNHKRKARHAEGGQTP